MKGADSSFCFQAIIQEKTAELITSLDTKKVVQSTELVKEKNSQGI